MVFGQETGAGGKKNAIAMDMIPLFRGFIVSDAGDKSFYFCMTFSYERLLFPHFAIGAKIDLFPGQMGENIPYMYFGMAANGRYYPLSGSMEKLFLGANLGFNLQAVNSDTKPESGGFVGLTVGLEAGYKLPLGKIMFVEPSISYTYSKTNFDQFGKTPHGLGWQAGLRVGVLL